MEPQTKQAVWRGGGGGGGGGHEVSSFLVIVVGMPLIFLGKGEQHKPLKRRETVVTITLITAGRWHALIGCYGRHRSPVARSNWLLSNWRVSLKF